MSAEFEVLYGHRTGRTSRSIAASSRPLIDDLTGGVTLSETDPTQIPISYLLSLCGMDREANVTVGNSILRDIRLTEPYEEALHEDIGSINALTTDQHSVLSLNVAPKFAEELSTPKECFTKGYRFYAGSLIARKVSALTTWPINENDMFLNGHNLKNIGLLAISMDASVRSSLPGLKEFIDSPYIRSYFLHFGSSSSGDLDAVGKELRLRTVLAGVGLALEHYKSLLSTYSQAALDIRDPELDTTFLI